MAEKKEERDESYQREEISLSSLWQGCKLKRKSPSLAAKLAVRNLQMCHFFVRTLSLHS